METPEHRQWMYNRKDRHNRSLSRAFIHGVEEFLLAASELDSFKYDGTFRCPCRNCRCLQFLKLEVVRKHLHDKGFQPDYYYWHNHGETRPSMFARSMDVDTDDLNNFEQMVMDVGESGFHYNMEPEEPNPNYAKFHKLLCAAQSPLWDGCEDHSVLSIAVRLMSIKSDYNIQQDCIDEIIILIKEVLPSGNRMPDNFYQTKRLVSQLGCGYTKIDCCPAGCMLFRREDTDVNSCKFCGEPRFKENATRKAGKQKEIPRKQMWYLPIIPRLQRLFASNITAKHMTWHHDINRDRGMLSHPSDGEGWKHFNQTHPSFASEPRNVRLGLCSDGFSPFNHDGRNYSCWPVILTPYNLPPDMCMKREYMFLSIIIPGPSNPKNKIDVFLQPLIDDLKKLWDGVQTYDVATKQNFSLRAALLWTINDFPAYGMLSGWSTCGRLGCPVCMEDSKSFYLKNGHKVSYFDCHRQFLPMNHPFRKNRKDFSRDKVEMNVPPRRRSGIEILERLRYIPKVVDFGGVESTTGYGDCHHWTKHTIFWDLPYWKDLMNPHNIDVMHTESNIFQNVFNTVMDVKGKTKDNEKARMDIALYCARPELELEVRENRKVVKPKAQYTLSIDQKRNICEWVRSLKLPDGYASNLGSCVDMRTCTLHHMKSHDCHVFMERLLPIAFSCLPTPIWECLTELSQFFRDLCSPVLEENNLNVMENNIPIILCKMEKIFPPAFFDVMEHLPIHLVYEAKVGGPVQYRWMYPFERFLHCLKKKVRNKARVEGSICEAYVLEETSLFCSYYFESHVQTRNRRVSRNDDGGELSGNPSISIFNYPGRSEGTSISRFLNDAERDAIHSYVLCNCPEVDDFYNTYISSTDGISPRFIDWFREYVHNPDNSIQDPFIQSLSWGPIHKVQTFSIYFVNNYCFHTSDLAKVRKTNNSGVALSGEDMVYHGILQEIIEVEYPGSPTKRITLFNVMWFDPNTTGTRKHPKYEIVDVKSTRRYNGTDTFIFAQQAEQVYFTPYPNPTYDKRNWLSVIKTKSRRTIQSPDIPFQDDMGSNINELSPLDEFNVTLRDFNHEGEELDFIENVPHVDSNDDDYETEEEHDYETEEL